MFEVNDQYAVSYTHLDVYKRQGKSSFKNVVVNDMMLDAYGKKMSKSTGNIIDPIKIMTPVSYTHLTRGRYCKRA